jgi:hypothetical protein
MASRLGGSLHPVALAAQRHAGTDCRKIVPHRGPAEGGNPTSAPDFLGKLIDCSANAGTAVRDLDFCNARKGCVGARYKCHPVCSRDDTPLAADTTSATRHHSQTPDRDCATLSVTGEADAGSGGAYPAER